MLQRIQSLYLAIVAIACILLFFFPLADYYNELEGNYKLFIYGVRSMDPEPKVAFSLFFTAPLIFMVVASFIFAVAAIFLFKNRPLQLRLCAFNMLTNIVLIMVIFFFYATKIKTMTLTEPEYNYTGMVLPLVSILFLIFANQAIRKDEKLVKSVDRLR
jgi:peptidoglycan/LPS O-acetylase OafA/YrhL